MKVRDLVKDTIWIPGSGYSDDHKPAISVLLPTYRRGASGLFRKAVQSVLGQTLEDIELIIVDDASTDGTADQIAELMRGDGRVSCLRHPRNIGLPAISEFEAFTKARADFIAFAFDDDIFYPDALEKLLEHSLANPGRVCYGYVTMLAREYGSSTIQSVRLGQPLSAYNLQTRNLISNSAVLLPRRVIDVIGLYDPNVVMTRICDWDLWRRVGEKYLLHYVDVNVGEITGPSTEDSLGKTYVMTSGASEEWMRADRRNLTPQVFLDIDVFSSRPGISARTTATIADLATSHISKRQWLNDMPLGEKSAQKKEIIVLTSAHNASTSLYFDYLPRAMQGQVRVILSQGNLQISELPSASCVVIVRHLDIHMEWINAAHQLGIPLYYFLDDNFTELSSVESYVTSEDFSKQQLRIKLKRFSGVLLSSPELLEYFDANLIHPNLYLFPVSYAKTPPEFTESTKVRDFELKVASIGGKHRQRGLRENVLPALRQLASKACRIHFIVGGFDAEDAELWDLASENRNLKITFLPFDIDWNRALLQLAEYRPDILIHAPSRTINNKYKTLNVALCAYLLDALLMVPNDPPYDIPAFDGASARVEPAQEPRAWLLALKRLIANRESWESCKRVNAAFCRTHFSGEQNLRTLHKIVEATPAVSPTTIESRLKEMLLSKASANRASDINSLKTSLLELSGLRTKIRRYRRFKPRLTREDLWPHVSPVFEDIRQYVQKNRIRTPNSYLELSDGIQDKVFVEYPIPLRSGMLRSISCAFSSEGVHEGLVGIELVTPDGDIAIQSTHALDAMDLQFPVTFDLKGTVVHQDGTWRLRLFARSGWPIYALEFATYSHLGWNRLAIAPFAKVEYVEQIQIAKVTRDAVVGGGLA